MPEIRLQTNDLINYSEAARTLNITRATLYAWIQKGMLTPLAIADRRYLLRSEVDGLKKAGEAKQPNKSSH